MPYSNIIGDNYPGAQVARDGRVVGRSVENFVPGAAITVLPDTAYNLRIGQQVLICSFSWGVGTSSDDCKFELGWCDAPDGGGTFHKLGVHRHCYTAMAHPYRLNELVEFKPPHIARWSDGARSVAIRVDANDASCEICCSWRGWVESE